MVTGGGLSGGKMACEDGETRLKALEEGNFIYSGSDTNTEQTAEVQRGRCLWTNRKCRRPSVQLHTEQREQKLQFLAVSPSAERQLHASSPDIHDS